MGPVWLLWNALPHLKPFFLTKANDYEAEIPYGTPIYENGKALETRRFFPEPVLGAALTRYVQEEGGVRFFNSDDWRIQLAQIVDRFRRSCTNSLEAGRLETEHAYDQRVRRELSESKALLEENMGKTVDAICWPGGGVNSRVLEIARETGYRRFTLPSKWRNDQAVGGYPDLVPRIGSPGRVHWRGRNLGRLSPREFIWAIESTRNSTWHMLLKKGAMAARLGLSFLREWHD